MVCFIIYSFIIHVRDYHFILHLTKILPNYLFSLITILSFNSIRITILLPHQPINICQDEHQNTNVCASMIWITSTIVKGYSKPFWRLYFISETSYDVYELWHIWVWVIRSITQTQPQLSPTVLIKIDMKSYHEFLYPHALGYVIPCAVRGG